MTQSEYRYEIEKAHYEITSNGSFLLTDSQFKLFADMARHSKTGSLVLDNWKIFLGSENNGTPEDYFEWWNKYKPWEIDDSEKAVKWNPEKKKSPFDAVKKRVEMF